MDINLDKKPEYEEFSLLLSERKIHIKKERIDVRGINNYVFVGNNNDGCSVLFSVLGENEDNLSPQTSPLSTPCPIKAIT